MNHKRLRHCGLAAGLLILSVPSAAHADDDDKGHESSHRCDDVTTATVGDHERDDERDESWRTRAESDEKGDDGDDDDVASCPPVPPVDVPEAPNAVMLSISAAVTGGAAILIVRRRSSKAALARA